MPLRNLAVELLQKLLKGDEIKLRSRRIWCRHARFQKMLEISLSRSQNSALKHAKVIEELIQLARYAAGPRNAARHSN